MREQNKSMNNFTDKKKTLVLLQSIFSILPSTPLSAICGAERAHHGQGSGNAVEGASSLDQVRGGRGAGDGPLGQTSRSFTVLPQLAGAPSHNHAG